MPGTAVTVPGINGKEEPAPLEALQAASDPSDGIVRAVSPHHAVDPDRRGPGPERLVGGRRQVAWYLGQAADTQATMPARVDVAVGPCG